MGCTILLSHAGGTVPVSKHLWNNLWRYRKTLSSLIMLGIHYHVQALCSPVVVLWRVVLTLVQSAFSTSSSIAGQLSPCCVAVHLVSVLLRLRRVSKWFHKVIVYIDNYYYCKDSECNVRV